MALPAEPSLSKKILAIDDDRIVRASVRKILESAGHRVITAASGREALDLYALEDFDLILTDIRMPEMDGLQTLTAIREVAEYLKKTPTPEIVLTAYNDKHVIERAREIGIADFLLKPFDVDDFLDTIHKYI